MTTHVIAQNRLLEVLQGRPIWTGNAEEHEKPVSDQAGRVRGVDNGPVGLSGPGRQPAGRAGSLNLEEQRSSRFRSDRSYGPPLRE